MKTNYVLWAVGNLYFAQHNKPPMVTCDSGDIEGIDWMDTPEDERFSADEIKAEIDRIKTIEEPTHYFRRDRARAYPEIGDQLDALYHAGVFPEDMAAKIREVKESFPKPDAASGNL